MTELRIFRSCSLSYFVSVCWEMFPSQYVCAQDLLVVALQVLLDGSSISPMQVWDESERFLRFVFYWIFLVALTLACFYLRKSCARSMGALEARLEARRNQGS